MEKCDYTHIDTINMHLTHTHTKTLKDHNIQAILINVAHFQSFIKANG